MTRKLISLLIALVLVFSLSLSVSAADTAPFVVDDADILSEEEERSLAAEARSYSEYLNFGIYLMTVADYEDMPDSDSIENAARTAYLDGGYGAGDRRSGILLLMSMNNRKYALYVNHDDDHAFSEYGHDYLADHFLSSFGDDQWSEGFLRYISTSAEMVEAAKNGEPVKEDLSHARFYGIIVCIVLGFVIAFIVKAVLKSQLTSVAEKSEASAFVAQGGLNLSQKTDMFTHRTQTRVYSPEKSDNNDSDNCSSSSGSF